MSIANDKTLVNIGRIGAAVGLKGEVKVILFAEDSENLNEGTVLLVDANKLDFKDSSSVHFGKTASGENRIYGVAGSRELEVVGIRMQKCRPIVKFAGVDDRSAAELLTGLPLYLPESELVELPDGCYYYRDLIGLEVRDSIEGDIIGEVNDIIDNTSQSIIEIRKADGDKVLIPYVDAFVKNISLESGIIEVELIPGLID